ncbi:MAG TPA: ABC transporter substrate-binding protein, partial [Chloroflexota bacterium]
MVVSATSRRDFLRLSCAAAGAMGLGAALQACGTGSRSGPSPSAAGSAQATYAFTLSYTTPSAAFAALWAGAEEGIFAKHSIEAGVRYMEANVVSGALVSGELDVATTTNVVNANLAGADMALVGNLIKGPIFSLYAEKAISRVEDLKGKVISDTPVGSGPDGALRDLLAKHGLKDTDVQLVYSTNPFGPLSSNQAAAAILPVPTTLQARNAGFMELTTTIKEGVPGLVAVLSVRRAKLRSDPASIRALLQALKDATDFMHANPARTKAIIGKYAKMEPGPDLDETYATYDPN